MRICVNDCSVTVCSCGLVGTRTTHMPGKRVDSYPGGDTVDFVRDDV